MASLFKRNNGIYYGVYWDGNRRVWISTHRKDEIEARHFLEQNVLQIERRRGVTISSFKKDFLEYAKAHYAEVTSVSMKIVLKLPPMLLETKLLKLVSVRDVDKFKEGRILEAKAVTVNIQFRTLKAAFEKAVRWGYIVTNPFKLSDPLRISYEEAPYVSRDEFSQLLQRRVGNSQGPVDGCGYDRDEAWRAAPCSMGRLRFY